MLTHGWAKLSNFSNMSETFPDPIGLGSNVALSLIIFAEFGCSLLLLVGLFTRWATIPLMIGMSVAVFVAHANDPFSVKELPVLYLLMYVVILIAGPGRYSSDALINKNTKRK
jgi:putative oxidoreductase